MKRVLCLLENGFEEIEAVTPVDLLRRAGVEVVMAGVSGMDVVGKCGMRFRADALLEDAGGGDFDVLLLAGGPAVKELRGNEKVLTLIRRFHSEDKLIAAICAAPLLLKDAGLIDGKRITAHFSTGVELPASTGEPVVVDGRLVTSRGAGTALDFGLELVRILCGKAVAEEVGHAVMV
jgi:4-methyl-5(b-hydroxyethyl)-thiazole monophosphate biosynthesis